MKLRRPSLFATALVLARALPLGAQSAPTLDSTWLEGFRWRAIGPANMAGRVTDVEGLPSPSKTFYFAAATGGIWKTTNGGTTFRPLFEDERVVSMGDLAIAPSDSLQVWAGTGEEDTRNSISPGGGIYKSTDGGTTWTLMGLEETEHIGRIVVHPRNPDVVWVAALGAAWRTNPERGLYKTTDGGRTWRLVKSVSDRAGFVDVAVHPRNPDVLLASSWERIRGPWFLQSGGPGSGLWRSEDGGETWERVEGGGFPETELGRIGIAYAPSDPDVVYALVEAAPREGDDGEERTSGLYRSSDGGRSWQRMNTVNVRPFYYSQVRVDPLDPDRVYFSSFSFSEDGGKTVRGAALGVHVDHHAIWIDPNDPHRLVVGNDGGIAISFDRGGNYIFPNVVPIGQFYAVSYDMAVPYRVCGGLQDNYSWCGPSRKAEGAITNHDWFRVSGGDGFVTQQDPRDPDLVYAESQGGNMRRTDLATGEQVVLEKPDWREAYRAWQDSIALLWPDSTRPMPAEHRTRIEELERRASSDSAALQLRYNWNTPFLLSPHDPDVFYAGANRVLKSTSRGDGLAPISPDLTRRDEEKIRVSTQTTGGITRDVTGAETFATIVSLAESPLRRGVLYAGTDDGNLWITPDNGGTWNDITGALEGLVPDGTYVSRIEPSAHAADRFYVSFDNHRRGDFTPYLLVTEDGGRSFRAIAGGLPTGGPDFVHVVREDPINPDLLYAGTDVGAYVSLDRGRSWQRFMEGLPTVPVHDLKVHPRDRELIAGTHGRSIWIVDVAPLQQLRRELVASDAHLFEPAPGIHFGGPPTGGEFTAQLYFQAPSPPYGAHLRYWLGEAQEGEVTLAVTDATGKTLRTLRGPGERGLHRVTWNLRGEAETLPLSPSERRDSVAIEARLSVVVDSLVAAGKPKQDVERTVERLRSPPAGGGFGGGGGGGGGLPPASAGEFVERPAEGAAPDPERAGPGGRGGGDEPSLQQEILRLVRGSAQGGRGRGRGGPPGLFPRRTAGAPPLAEPGTYTVTLTVGERTLSQSLRVERSETAPGR